MVLPCNFFFLICSLTLISTHLITLTNGDFSEQSHIILPSNHQIKEKLTHLHFYYHDITNTNYSTILQIIGTPKDVPNEFGSLFVMDDQITEGPELNSKHIGRAQGLFGEASLNDLGMFMMTNFVFTNGEYSGSTLSMLGRNLMSDQNREMSIVGGTGVFRFARGYAIANSLYSISSNAHFVIEYNVTVSHP